MKDLLLLPISSRLSTCIGVPFSRPGDAASLQVAAVGRVHQQDQAGRVRFRVRTLGVDLRLQEFIELGDYIVRQRGRGLRRGHFRRYSRCVRCGRGRLSGCRFGHCRRLEGGCCRLCRGDAGR